jgi:integrase
MRVTIRQSLDTGSKAMAERLISAIMRDIEEGRVVAVKAKTFKDAVSDYSIKGGKLGSKIFGDFDRDTGEWSKLLGAFGDMAAEEITEDHLLDYCRKNHLRSKPATWNRHVFMPVKAVLKKNRLMNWAHIDKLPEERVESPYATPEYFAKAIKAYSRLPHLAAIIMTMAQTGRRVGECINWMRDDVNWDLGWVSTGRTKNGDPITVQIPERLLGVLLALPRFENGRLFGYQTNTSLRPSMVRCCAAAKIPYMSPHRIGRHTFASWSLIYNHMGLKEIKEAGGWKTMSQMERYVHVKPTDAQILSARLMSENPILKKIHESGDMDPYDPGFHKNIRRLQKESKNPHKPDTNRAIEGVKKVTKQ